MYASHSLDARETMDPPSRRRAHPAEASFDCRGATQCKLPPCLALLTILVALACLPALSQPDPQALVERAVQLQKANAAREKELAYRERVVNHDLDGAWKPRRSKDKVHDVLWIEGTPQRILLEEDGTPQSATMIRASQNFLSRVVEIRKAESARERRERVDAFDRKQNEYQEAVQEIPRAFEFTLAGEESVKGRLCFKLRANPRRDYRPSSRYGKIFAHTEGIVWIDKVSGEWRRAEGELRETVNLGWIFVQIQKGTKAVAEQQEFRNHGWLMSSLWYRTVARVGLFVNYRREHRGDYWGYQPMTQSLLARALGEGYPVGPMLPGPRQSQ